jgi:hypothetical protein
MTAVTGWTTTERGGVRLEQHNITYLRSHDERLWEKREGSRKEMLANVEEREKETR